MATKKSSPKKTGKTPAKKKPAARKKSPEGQTFIRSIYGSQARISLDNGTEFHLEPRGQVGDLAAVDQEDRDDPKYARNHGLLFEELSWDEGRKVIESQATNAQAPRPSLMDHIKNERGESYDQTAPRMEQSFEDQGTVVANISDGPAGRNTDGTGEIITRASGEAPLQESPPGSVGNPVLPGVSPDNQGAAAADAKARESKNPQQAADDLRNSLSVSVAPTQKG